jgi:hypothetical protein
MIIDALYIFKKDAGKKTKYSLAANSEHYEPLHKQSKRSNDIPLYLTSNPGYIDADPARKPALGLSTAGGVHCTGLFIPDPNRPNLAYGDYQADAFLCFLSEGEAEVFICKGKKNLAMNLYGMAADLDIDLVAEIADHRQRATGIK